MVTSKQSQLMQKSTDLNREIDSDGSNLEVPGSALVALWGKQDLDCTDSSSPGQAQDRELNIISIGERAA